MRKYVYMAIVLAICIWGINTVTIKASDLNKNEEYMSIDDFEINDSIKTLEKNGYRDLNFRHILDEIDMKTDEKEELEILQWLKKLLEICF